MALTATALAIARWAEDKALLALALLAFAAAIFGRWTRTRTGPPWVRAHLLGMSLSYVTMLTAFYVDNGPNLPVWRSLPPVTYWTAPALVALPIIIATLLRHPLVRSSRPFPR